MEPFGGSDIFGDLNVDPQSKSLLQTISKWAKLAAIVGLLSAVLSLVATITGITKSQVTGDQLTNIMARTSLLIIIPVAIAMIVMNIFLLRFAVSSGASLQNLKQEAFNMSINFLKMYFKTLGIIIIIAIGLVIVLMIAFALGAVVSLN